MQPSSRTREIIFANDSDAIGNYQTGPVIHTRLSDGEFTFPREQEDTQWRSSTGFVGSTKQEQLKPGAKGSKRGDKKYAEILSTDCISKRSEIVLKQQNPDSLRAHPLTETSTSPPGFQRLRPKHHTRISNFTTENFNAGSLQSEHIPQCTSDGKYEPIQCHRIGYCWCVNKFGQAIKNSAMKDEKPICDSTKYESESNDVLVVTGVSAHRIKNLLKSGGGSSNSEASSAVNHQSAESDLELGAFNEDEHQPRDHDYEFNRRVSLSQEPILALVPYECGLSRVKAKERASKHSDDSIWIPDCDDEDEKLYAKKQCHKSKVCWCVDQTSGLPLRTLEPLTKQSSINCTDVKRISVFQGFSATCDAGMRIEFVNSLINQFRRQLSELKRVSPTGLPLEGSTITLNPYRMSESQISQWKFVTMDMDHNGKLDNREWSNFKNHFKTVEKYDGSQRASVSTLYIPRSQRKCWRDFLQFCGNGDILTDESVVLSKWLSCTELPPKAQLPPSPSDKGRSSVTQQSFDEIPENKYAHSEAAAIARSKKRNPFLGILKPN